MHTRLIPSSGEQIPVIGLGTWQTFDVGNDIVKLANLEKIVKTFVQMGGTLIDASPMYGTAEKVCLLYTSPSPRDATLSRMPSSA